jgi:circadian clock protein KaiC
MKLKNKRKPEMPSLAKCLTGIDGLDEITGGGLPQGRPTLLCGAAGCCKTLLAMEFLVRGATQYDETGVFMAFEETAEELAQNVVALGFDVKTLSARKKLRVDYVHVEPSEIEDSGDYDLEGLFIRLGDAIDSVGAKRVVLDTIEALFGGFTNTAILRAELRRLFRWLKDKGVTAIITAERGEGAALTRYGLEEYISDCVILLDHRVTEQTSTRRLRVVKYRGSRHGTNEYPFLIGERGFSVLPITSIELTHPASNERVSSGIAGLDAMLDGKGYFRGSTVLLSGTAGTGKSSVAAHFADAACRRGERCLYFAFEESMHQIMRNMRSIGIDLEPWLRKGLLQFHAVRPTFYGLETHLATIHQLISEFRPRVVIFDPITNLNSVGGLSEVKNMLMRLVDVLKTRQITALLTSLTGGNDHTEQTDVGVSSIVDTWLLLRDIELNGERNRGLFVLKSRGMAHSNQIREFLLTKQGIELKEVYLGPEGVLTGSARVAQEAAEQLAVLANRQEVERRQLDLERKRAALEVQIAALRVEFTAEENELEKILLQETRLQEKRLEARKEMAHSREAPVTDKTKPAAKGGNRGVPK